MSKGHVQRPASITEEERAARWERAFGRKHAPACPAGTPEGNVHPFARCACGLHAEWAAIHKAEWERTFINAPHWVLMCRYCEYEWRLPERGVAQVMACPKCDAGYPHSFLRTPDRSPMNETLDPP